MEIYQHQALWDNRQHPWVHQAFSEIWGNEKLWVSVDWACMKPPVREDKPEYSSKGFVHWDVDTAVHPVPFGVQGVLYLTDTAEDQGGSSACRVFTERSTNGSRRSRRVTIRAGPICRDWRSNRSRGRRGSVDLASDAVTRQWPQPIRQSADGAVSQHVAGGKQQREAKVGDQGLAGAASDTRLAGRRPRLGA